MIDRQEKLWLIRQQIARAIAEIDHGDTAQSCLALANALGAILSLIESVNATQESEHRWIQQHRDTVNERLAALERFQTKELELKEQLPPDVRKALDELRGEQTKIKRR